MRLNDKLSASDRPRSCSFLVKSQVLFHLSYGGSIGWDVQIRTRISGTRTRCAAVAPRPNRSFSWDGAGVDSAGIGPALSRLQGERSPILSYEPSGAARQGKASLPGCPVKCLIIQDEVAPLV